MKFELTSDDLLYTDNIKQAINAANSVELNEIMEFLGNDKNRFYENAEISLEQQVVELIAGCDVGTKLLFKDIVFVVESLFKQDLKVLCVVSNKSIEELSNDIVLKSLDYLIDDKAIEKTNKFAYVRTNKHKEYVNPKINALKRFSDRRFVVVPNSFKKVLQDKTLEG